MPRKSMTFRLDTELVERVDVAAGEVGVNRTAFLEGALELALGGSPVAGRSPERVGVVPAPAPAGGRPAFRSGAVSSASAKRGVAPRWRGGVEGSV